MLRVSSKGKHIEWDNHIQTPKSPDSSTTMRKTRSVDFSRMTIRTSIGHSANSNTTAGSATTAASHFSRRAARGSFKGYVAIYTLSHRSGACFEVRTVMFSRCRPSFHQ